MKRTTVLIFAGLLTFTVLVARAQVKIKINVAFFYTPAAAAALGNQSIDQAISQDIVNVNTALDNSRVDGEIQDVCIMPIALQEQGNLKSLLDKVVSSGNNPFTAIRDIRDLTAADLVVIVAHYPGECGISGEFGTPGQAFIVLNDGCLGANYSLAREFGYLMGCGNHESQSGRFNENNAAALGYIHVDEDDPSKNFNTIMGYSDEQISSTEPDFSLIPCFSNPDVNYNGLVTGDASHNNAKQMNDYLPILAEYRQYFGMYLQSHLIMPAGATTRVATKRKIIIENSEYDNKSKTDVRSGQIILRTNVNIQKGSKVKLWSGNVED